MVPKALLAVLTLTSVASSLPVAPVEHSPFVPDRRGLTIPFKWIAPSLIGGIVLDRWEGEGAQGIIGSSDPPRPSNPTPYSQPMVAPVPSRPYRFYDRPGLLPRRDEADQAAVNERSSSVTSSPPAHELQTRASPWVWVGPSLLAGSLVDRLLFGHHRTARPAQPVVVPQPVYPYSPYPQPMGSPYLAGRPARPMPPNEIYPRGFDPEMVSKVIQLGPEAAMRSKSILAPLAITGSSLGMEGMLESSNDYSAYNTRAERPSDVSVRTVANEVSLSRRAIPWKWLLGGAALGGLIDHIFFGGSSSSSAPTPDSTSSPNVTVPPDTGKGGAVPDGSATNPGVEQPHHPHHHTTPATDPNNPTEPASTA
ncbi:hypothetical protein OC846_005971 [Tilletia horrida]|uniref:Transmembrane protein n=1 Tax=Tilletia horrida TaxID=155126 RepID=A0AAN6JPR4_9BASI|nr:hypothetical protein OC846_005971 [Tilletia horrida]